MVNNNLVGGWPTPLKYDGVKVSWDDEYSQYSQLNGKIIQMFQTTNQLWYVIIHGHIRGIMELWN